MTNILDYYKIKYAEADVRHKNHNGGIEMSIVSKQFGKFLKGEVATCYTLDNGNGLIAEVLDYGCIIKNLYVKDRNGEYVDVVLGRDTLAEYGDNDGYFGAVIGRNANRIANSRFNIKSKTYKLNANDGRNNLHGGLCGFDKKLWRVTLFNNPKEPSIMFKLRSPNGEEGFPGELDVTVTYTLTKNNGFLIDYVAVGDEDTVCNLTNHSYFNLNGHDSGKTVDNLKLKINSNFYTPNTKECLPNGEIRLVKGTPFDFTKGKLVGQDINSDTDEQIKMFGGYDHNFILEGNGRRKAASLYCEENGIKMDMYTDSIGVQLYTGNCIDEKRKCKGKTVYSKHSGLCLETQFIPNSFSFDHFPKPILPAGKTYHHVTEYRFSTKAKKE